MKNYVWCLIISSILCSVATQTLDDIIRPKYTSVKNSKCIPCNSKFEDILPTLDMIKNNPNIKKERLYNVAKILKYLLADDKKSNQREVKEIINLLEDSSEAQTIPDFEKILEERFKTIDKSIDPKSSVIKEENDEASQNKTANLNRILSKINTALANHKSNNEASERQNPSQTVPIFRNKSGCKPDSTQPSENPAQFGYKTPCQAEKKPKSNPSTFTIPCQRASDILSETANFPVPQNAYCDISPIDLNSLGLNPRLNLENLGIDPSQIVPNSVSCVDSEDTIGVVFKPKIVSMMQMYGNLLKKISVTILVPYYAAKIAS